MKTFRKIWLIIVLMVSIAFVGYKAYRIKTTDYSRPVFSCAEDVLHVSVQDGEEVLLNGITASDKKDGDVTDSILVEKISGIYGDNTRKVTYTAFDSDGYISTMEREIVYTDYTSPRFTLKGSLRFKTGETINVDELVGASDCIDGDISNQVKIKTESIINNRTAGLYPVEFEVTNSAGDTVEVAVEVEVYQPNEVQMELQLTDYLVYYEGKSINYSDYLKSIKDGSAEYFFDGADSSEEEDEDVEEDEGLEENDGDGSTEGENRISKKRVTIDSKVDTQNPGVYPVYFYYRYDESQGTYKAMEVMYVVVE